MMRPGAEQVDALLAEACRSRLGSGRLRPVTAEIDFIDRLVGTAPELEPALEEHLQDQEGEVLPYVFTYEVAKWLDGAAKADRSRAADVLSWLEDELARGDFDVRNLIDVGIVEMLPSVPEGRPVLDLLPSGLRGLAEEAGLFLPREEWPRSSAATRG